MSGALPSTPPGRGAVLLTRFMACGGDGGRVRRAREGHGLWGRVLSPPSTQRPPGCQLPGSPGKLGAAVDLPPAPLPPRGRLAGRGCPGQGGMTETRCPLGLARPQSCAMGVESCGGQRSPLGSYGQRGGAAYGALMRGQATGVLQHGAAGVGVPGKGQPCPPQ